MPHEEMSLEVMLRHHEIIRWKMKLTKRFKLVRKMKDLKALYEKEVKGLDDAVKALVKSPSEEVGSMPPTSGR